MKVDPLKVADDSLLRCWPGTCVHDLQVLAKPVDGQPELEEERVMWPWWKAKKVGVGWNWG